MKQNILIEGIPGSGKSTLMRTLSKKLPDYHAYYEGDLSPVELAWCSYMTKEQYEDSLQRYPEHMEAIREYTRREDSHYIVAYTRILAESRQFYTDMEQYELYGGRRTWEEFWSILFHRWNQYHGDSNIFECSFFQNTMDELLLFFEKDENEILAFYRELCQHIDLKKLMLIYLDVENPEKFIKKVSEERVDEQGNPIWWNLILQYFALSPYGKRHQIQDEQGIYEYFKKRIALEHRIIEEIIPRAIRVPAHRYEIDQLMEEIK